MKTLLRRLATEPLAHFFALGGLLFGLFALVGTQGPTDQIVVDRVQVDRLAAGFERAFGRPPTADELHARVQAWVDDEILYREGRALGLDRDDDVVRRRVVQRMDFELEGSGPAAPSDDELRRWLAEHPENYRTEPRITLRQIYFDPTRRGEALATEVLEALATLRESPTEASVGDPIMLPPRVQDVAASEIARQFGTDFQRAVFELQPGRWDGPVPSGFGVHLVKVESREDGVLPPLSEVRDAVLRDATREAARVAKQSRLVDLEARYDVVIDVDLRDYAAGLQAP